LKEAIIVRNATPRDAISLAGLAAQLGYPTSDQKIEKRMTKYSDNPDERVIVAELAGEVVGWTSVAVVDHFYTDIYVEISGLVIDEKHRSKGIGSLLLGEVRRWAGEKGVATVRLRANILRKDAHRFYEREGFTRVKEQIMFEAKVGEWRMP